MDSIVFFVFLLFSLNAESNCEDPCRQLEFRAALSFQGKRLINHVIQTVETVFKDFCGVLCFMEPNCVSYNMELKSPSITKCELNNSTHNEHPSDLKTWQNYTYRGLKNACGGKPCENNGTCQAGFTSKGYRCLCPPEFKGQKCTEDVNECTSATHKCHANADCVNTHGSFNCTCKAGYTGDGRNCTDVNECTSATHKCHANADCVNTHGSFNCTCEAGYTGDGRNCTDIDECAAQVKPCDAVANYECKNTPGSYNCHCKDGFLKNGHNCEADICKNYQNLTDAERKYDYVTVNPKCDEKLKGWYRFQGAAGTKMVTTCPSMNSCDTISPAWLSGDHPTEANGTVTRTVCIRFHENCCDKSASIKVKNCGSYYIYYFNELKDCDYRYCGTD